MLPLNEYDNRLTQITKHIMSIHSLNVWYFNGRSQRLLLGKLDQKLENSKLTNDSGGKIQLD